MRQVFGSLGVIVLLGLCASGSNAQHEKKDEKKARPEAEAGAQWRTVTKWIAERPVGPDGYEKIGEYDTYAEAEAACKNWSDAHPEVLRLTRTREVKMRVRDLPRPTQKPKPEDPPLSGRKSPLPKAPGAKDNPNSVAGRKGKGKIADSNVTFTFAKDGTFTVTGDLEGSGKWTQTGKAVTMETQISKFQGVAEDNKIRGVRVRRSDNGKILKDDWSVQLSPVPEKATGEAALIGTWVGSTDKFFHVFEAGGKYKNITPDGRLTDTGSWKLTGETITISWDRFTFQTKYTLKEDGIYRDSEFFMKKK